MPSHSRRSTEGTPWGGRRRDVDGRNGKEGRIPETHRPFPHSGKADVSPIAERTSTKARLSGGIGRHCFACLRKRLCKNETLFCCRKESPMYMTRARQLGILLLALVPGL